MNLTEQLQQHLLERGYRPGERIEPELELAEHFGVARAKIREVLNAFCQEGLLERHPRRGTVVRDLDVLRAGRDLDFRFQLGGLDPADAWEARRVIELAILPLVVRRITPAQVRDAAACIDRMEARLEEPAAVEAIDAEDQAFHLALLSACGNRTLQCFAGVIAGLFREAVRRPFRTPEKFRATIKKHRELLAAIRADDVEAACRLMDEHLLGGKK